MADGEGFEPPEALRLQRFSRPSHSTALPPILNFFSTDLSNRRGFGLRETLFRSTSLRSQDRRIRPRLPTILILFLPSLYFNTQNVKLFLSCCTIKNNYANNKHYPRQHLSHRQSPRCQKANLSIWLTKLFTEYSKRRIQNTQ